MSGRMITYDEIQLEVLACHDLTTEERKEVLEFIKDFKQSMRLNMEDTYIPPRLRKKISMKVSQ